MVGCQTVGYRRENNVTTSAAALSRMLILALLVLVVLLLLRVYCPSSIALDLSLLLFYCCHSFVCIYCCYNCFNCHTLVPHQDDVATGANHDAENSSAAPGESM